MINVSYTEYRCTQWGGKQIGLIGPMQGTLPSPPLPFLQPMADRTCGLYLPSGSLRSNSRVRSENCSEMARAPAFFIQDKNV